MAKNMLLPAPRSRRHARDARSCVLTYQGVTRTIQEWGALTGILPQTLHHRYYIAGWSVEQTLERPVGATGRRHKDYSNALMVRAITRYLEQHPKEARRLALKYGWKEAT